MSLLPGASALVACLLLAGCCDQAAVQACETARDQQAAQALAREAVANLSAEPFELRVATVDGVKLQAAVVEAGCVDGRAAAARIRITWEVKTPGVNAVRILVGSSDKADKTWIEAGASGTETTGPWINDGALLRMQSQSTGEALGQVRAQARACR